MSEAVWVAVIGGIGTLVGAIATVVVARIQAAQQRHDAEPATQTLVPGELVDGEELRILRALYGERRGRWLEAYKGAYYRPFLDKVVKRGWVERVDRRYFLTAAGADVCRRHLAEFADWRP